MKSTAKSRARSATALSVAVLALFGAVPASQAKTVTSVVAFDYDADGVLTKTIVEPGDSSLCLVTKATLDNYGNPSGQTVRNCNGEKGSVAGVNDESPAPTGTAVFDAQTSSSTFADPRFLNSAKNALLHETTLTHHANTGALTSVTDPNKRKKQWSQDSLGRPYLYQGEDGNGSRQVYEYCKGISGGTVDCPSVSGRTSSYVITTIPVATVDVSKGTYGAANGPATKTYFDAWKRPIRVESETFVDGEWLVVETVYDNRGRVSSQSLPFLATSTTKYWTNFKYDILDRKTEVTRPDGGYDKTTYADSTISVESKVLDAATTYSSTTQTVVYHLDVMGRTSYKEDGLKSKLTFGYDAGGRLETVRDSAGNEFSSSFDERDRLVETVDPDLGTYNYKYDALGNLVGVNGPDDISVQNTYDVLQRITKKKSSDYTLSWFYDDKYKDGTACPNAIGALCEVISANAFKRRMTYDALGRATAIVTDAGKDYPLNYGYNAAGLLETVTYPGGFAVKRVYTTKGQLKQITSLDGAKVYWEAKAFDAFGLLKTYALGNGVSSTTTRDAKSGRSTSIVSGTGGAVQSQSFTYDYLGNVRSTADNRTGVKSTLDYDNTNRLRKEARIGGALTSEQSIIWGYDAVGNLTSRSDIGTWAYPTGGLGVVRPHAVTGVTGSVNGVANPKYDYDNRGNMKTGAGRTFSWMSFDQPASVSRGSNRLEWTYDSEFQRVQEVFYKDSAKQRTTTYVHAPAGQGLIFEEEKGAASLLQKNYISVGGIPVAVAKFDGTTTTLQYLHQDILESETTTTSATGAVVERLAYEPYGKRRYSDGRTDAAGTLPATSTDRGFTGHEMLDEMNLVNMNGRLYEPTLGRFVSADPIVQDPSELQSYNRYAYVWNNPLDGTDPSGFNWKSSGKSTSGQNGFEFVAVVETDHAGTYIAAGRVGWSNSGPSSAYAYGSPLVKTDVSVAKFGSVPIPDLSNAQSNIAVGRTLGEIEGAQRLSGALAMSFVPGPGVIDGVEQIKGASGFAGVAAGAGMIITELPGLKMVKGPAKAGDVYIRLRTGTETLKDLARQAKSAEKHKDFLIHGVSVFKNKLPPKLAHRLNEACTVSCQELEAVFKRVERTGHTEGHYTVELPKPLTQDVVDLFNLMFTPVKP